MTLHVSVPSHPRVRGCYALPVALALGILATVGALRPAPTVSAPTSAPQVNRRPVLTGETCDAPAFGEPMAEPVQPLQLTC